METKICSKCKQEKDVKNFHFKKTEGRKSSWCKECVYNKQKNRWKDRKRKSVEMMGRKCCLCGYDKNLSALEFHHKNPSEKEFNFSKLREMKWESVIKELKKCMLLCSNCHREIHNPSDNKKENFEDNNLLNYSPKIKENGRISDDLSHQYLISTGKCPFCGCDVFGTKYCSVDCVSKDKRKVKNRPSKSELMKLLETSNFSAIGRDFGVSDKAIRKWAKTYGIIK